MTKIPLTPVSLRQGTYSTSTPLDHVALYARRYGQEFAPEFIATNMVDDSDCVLIAIVNDDLTDLVRPGYKIKLKDGKWFAVKNEGD